MARNSVPQAWDGRRDDAMQTGAVQFFYKTDIVNPQATYISKLPLRGRGPKLRMSHGWLDGSLQEPWNPTNGTASKEAWPLVLPSPDIRFITGRRPAPGTAEVRSRGPRRVHPSQVREATTRPPRLSLVLVRWGGEHVIGAGSEGDGGWGRFGCPPSDEYMQEMVENGVLRHPALIGEDGRPGEIEIFSLFVGSTRDVTDLEQAAPWLAASLRGDQKALFWMLWPAEWEDTSEADYAGYVQRRSLFSAMRACEEVGLKSGFPHPADLYEIITSKTWMASLCLTPQAHLPAACLLSKGAVLRDPLKAARTALQSLDHIRRLSPFPAAAGEPAAPSVVNASGNVRQGVVKLGWSWEGRYVVSFKGEEQLAQRFKEFLSDPGCMASSILVQEWVDFDFEMRLYFLPPWNWQPGQKLQPARFECNAWEGFSEEGRPQTFRKLSEAMCLGKWSQDDAALASAREQAVDISQFLLAWLRVMDAMPVPMIRLDFMLRRIGPGKVRVIFGEYCEMGACCLGWEDGPPTIWRAAIDAVMR